MSFKYFTYYVLAPLILSLGLLGNIFGLIVLSKKKMIRIGPRNMFQYLFVMDTAYLVQIMFNYMSFAYRKTFAFLSPFACKFYYLINYSLDPISSYLLVYLSIDRLVSIRYPHKRSFFRTFRIQFIFFLVSIGINLIIFSPLAVFTNYKEEEKWNTTVKNCNIETKEAQDIIFMVDLVTRIIIPFLLMISCSVCLLITIFKSRITLSGSSSQSNRVLKRDIKFAVTSVCLNLVYILLNIPIIVVFSIEELLLNEVVYEFSFYLFYVPYGINFYLLFISNSIFRKEFFSLNENVQQIINYFVHFINETN